MFKQADLPTLHRMQDASKRIAAMIHARAVKEYGLAFGNPNATGLDWCVIHNSIVSRDNGTPWAEVDYAHMRRAAWLCDRQYIAAGLVNAWYRRKCGIVQ